MRSWVADLHLFRIKYVHSIFQNHGGTVNFKYEKKHSEAERSIFET